MENLEWNEKTLPSEILRQILKQEESSEDRTNNNLYALAFATGKAEALEYLHSKSVVDETRRSVDKIIKELDEKNK